MARATELSSERRLFLDEVGRVGSNQAGAALSMLLRAPVDVLPRNVIPTRLAELPRPDVDIFVAVYFTLYGKDRGSMVLMLPRDDACRIADVIGKKPLGTVKVLDEPAQSMMREIANILSGAYLGAIRTLVPTTLIQSIPYLAIDQWDAILDSLLPLASQGVETVVLIESELRVETIGARCYLLLLAGQWAS